MQTLPNKPPPHLWWLRMATFLIAALAAASAAYWVLKWPASASAHSPMALAFADATDPQGVARLLGGGQAEGVVAPDQPQGSAASRFKLTGVVADRAEGGYALIAIDGQPAKPYRVGALIHDSWVLHSVAPRSAALATSANTPASLTLTLPPLGQP